MSSITAEHRRLTLNPLVECICSFSDARRPEVVDAIVAALRSGGSADVQVLNVSSDTGHDRTAVTFAGPPAEVEAAAFAGIAQAAQLIDLSRQPVQAAGLGAAETVTFVPIRDASLTDGIALARRLGSRVGSELKIPVYLYEAAATRPERESVDNLRRLRYETLKAEIATNPAREPDFGPRQLGPAGATFIGAEAFLVAFNLSLNTADVAVARQAAQAVRQAWGGLRHLKAQAMMADGQAQVCLSIANVAQAPLARVVEFVRREVERCGASIVRTEVVGLIPQSALIDAAQWYLQLDGLEADQILGAQPTPAAETAAAPETPAFLERLAAGTAAPGGGAATAYAGAMAAALVSMVARLTIGRKKYAAVEAQMQSVLDSAERLRADLTAAVQDDAAAFEDVLAAYRQPAESADEDQTARGDAIEQAYAHASEVPLRTARNAVAVLGLAQVAAEKGNLNAVADAASAGHLARAALAGAALNVRMNAAALRDRQTVAAWLKELAGLEARAGDALAAIERTVRERKSA
ncbi:MAG TPA: glutamate formimidoyltransferase [Rhodocyclaceae bacterium]|nr:glutamate formimidoyltransferase [Rhodocyclaceae bacterium]